MDRHLYDVGYGQVAVYGGAVQSCRDLASVPPSNGKAAWHGNRLPDNKVNDFLHSSPATHLRSLRIHYMVDIEYDCLFVAVLLHRVSIYGEPNCLLVSSLQ